MVALRLTTFRGDLGQAHGRAQRRWTLALAAVAVTAVAFVAGMPGTQTWVHVATPHFLSNALGRPLQAPRGALVPKLFVRAGYATPRITNDSFALARSGSSVSLTSAPGTAAGWSRHAGGVTRSTYYGRTTITVGTNSIEQFLTVGRHLGSRTWTWNLSARGLIPRLGSDGQVHFYDHGRSTAWRVGRPLIQDGGGAFITPPGTQWTLRKTDGKWILGLTVDDSYLPVPYTIDPAVDYASPLYETVTTSTVLGGPSAATQPGHTLQLSTNSPSSICTASNTTTNTCPGFNDNNNSNGTFYARVANFTGTGAAPPNTGFSSATPVAPATGTSANGGFLVDAAGASTNGTRIPSGTWTFDAWTKANAAHVSGVSIDLTVGVYVVTTSGTGTSATISSIDQTVINPASNASSDITASTTETKQTISVSSVPQVTLSSSQRLFVVFYAKKITSSNTRYGDVVWIEVNGTNGTVTTPSQISLPTAFDPCTTCTWTGGGGDSNWTTAANWGGFLPLTDGTSTLVFPSSASQKTNTNNELSGTTFAGITIQGSGYTLGGNQVTLGASGISDTDTSGSNTISLPLALASGRTVSVTNSGETLTLSGLVSGAGLLTKTGSGALTLSGANNTGFTGGVTLSAGQLNINNAQALGTGTLTISGGTIDNTSGGSITESTNNAQTWSGDFTFAGSNALNVGTGAVTLGASRQVTVSGSTLTVGGAISGSTFGLTKAGGGTLTLTGSNTYTGNTTISAGTLNANSTSALGGASNTLVFNGGTLQAGGTITSPSTRAVTLSSAGTIDTNGNSVSIAGVISGSNGLTKSGTGTLTLTGTNTYSGSTTISGGTLNANASAAIGDGSATNTLVFNGGALQAGGTVTSPSTRAVTLSSAGTIDTNGNSVSIAGVISGSNGLTKSGTGTLTLTGTNTYSGSTTISGGTLNANASAAIGDGSATNTLVFNGGTLQAAGTITSPSARGVSLTGAGTIDTNGNAVSVAGVISGSNGLTKSGTGTLTLTGSNTYSGSTTISAGTLSANASAAIGDGSATNTLIFNGGTLQAAGTITSSSARGVTLSSAGTIDTNGNAVSVAGVISGSGGLTKSGAGTLTLTGSNTYSGSTTISAGTLNANATAAIGDGSATNTLVFNGGTLQAGGTITSPSTRGVTLSSTGTVDTNGNGVSIAGVISGANGLTKSGTGTLTLTGTNTYTGSTTISGGTLNANASAAIGNGSATNTLIFNGGTLQAAGTITSPSARGVTLSAAGTIDTNGNNVSIAGVISGANGLTKSGTGTLTLTGTNTYSGATTISGGTLNANASAAIGDGSATNTLVFSGGTLQAGGAITSPSTRAVTLSSTGTIDTNGNAVSVAGVISGANGLTKSGTNTLTLTGTNTYSGSTTISGGTLNANASAAIGDGSATNTLVFNGGTLQAAGAITSPSTRAVSLTGAGTIDTNGNSVSVAGVISGSSGLTKSGTGTLTLTGTNTYSGSTTISAGTLSANASAAIGDGSATNTLIFNGGTLQAGGAITSPSARGVTLSSAGTIDTNGNAVSIAGVISGSGGLTKSGAGTLTLTGSNTYSGSTTISAGTLNANATAAIGDGSATNTLVFNGGTLQAAGTITSPSTRGVTLSSTSTVDTNGNSVSIAGSISGSSGLTKSGAGTLTLSGNSNYSGTITVSAGTLTVNGTQSSSPVSLNGGTLNGTGTTGAVTSTASGGTLSPGAPAPGILNSGNVNLSSGSPTFSVALNGTTAGSGYSQQNVTGTVNLTGATLSASLGYTPTNGDAYTIVSNDGADAVTGTFSGLPQGTGFVIGGKSFRISYTGGTGNDVVLTAGGATKLAITSVPANATANVNFSVTVQSQDANGNCVQVNSNTAISLASDGAGTLSGNTGTITAGTCTVTLSSVQDNQGETIHLTASRTSGDSLTTSAASSAIVVANGTFTTNTAVAINGTPQVDTATTLTAGTYSPVTPTGRSYQWQLCDSSGNSCSNISGATSSTYTPVASDVGSTLRVVETVTHAGYNNGGSTSAASPVVIKANFTTNTAVSVSGTPTVGTAFTRIAGSYTPTPTSFAYQWELCDSSGNSCSNISGATSSSYTPVAGDVGSTLRVVETVSKAGYNDGSSTSNASAVVVKGTITTNTAVSINGTPTVDTATTITIGSYSPSPSSRAYQWELCNSSGGSCANISGATSNTYTPVASDVGSTLRVVETVSLAGYNDGSSTSAASPVVVKASFTTNTAVAINGTPTVDTASTITIGSFTPSPTSRAYQWRLCDSSGGSCSDISGATSNTYTPVPGDVGSTLRVVETVSKAGYNDAVSTSAASPVVIKASFTTNTAVSINGTPTVDTASTITVGSYTPSPSSRAYQWELCNSSGGSCANISGATSNTYTPVPSDVGSTLRVVETASKSGYNDAISTSAASPVVIKASFTTNTAVSINGTPTVGTSSTITIGSYSPSPTSRAYQWELCDSSGNSCSNISGATSSTYTPVAGDVGSTLRVVETVSKSGYNDAVSTSAASPLVIKGSFSTSTNVSINGWPVIGTTTTITNGVYSVTAPVRSYQWELCDSSGNSCSDISGETSNSYTPVAGDYGSTLRVVETVSRPGYNDGGSTSSASQPVAVGTISTTTAVSINAGTPTVAASSTLTAGSYSPTPTSVTDQWERCDSGGNNCVNISGATSSSYTPVAADVGSTLRVVETASKAGYADGVSTSAMSPVVVKASFTTNTAVSLSGTPTVGAATTRTAGSYTPSPTSSAYQWKLCDSAGNNCANISGATSSSYTPVAGDVGLTLRVVETVSKAGYNDRSSTSAASALVIKGTFSTTTAVAVNGTPKVGTATTRTVGSYSPTPGSYSYQWKLCNSLGSSCSNITGATTNAYTPVPTDVGSTLRLVETVSKAGYNQGSSTSNASPVVAKGNFAMTTAVAINGQPAVGTAATITTGTYSPTPTSSSYQWELCDSLGNSCSNIGGATSNTYTPVSGQEGSTLRVVETVSHAGYNNGSSTSNAVLVYGIFSTTTPVAITGGTPTVGTMSHITLGAYTPAPTGRSYQWKRCDSAGNNCVNISAATFNVYTPVAADVGKTLRVVETVTKSLYVNGSSTSAASPVVILGTFVMNTQVAIFGYPKRGVTSSITQGSYTPTPTSRTYKWLRCGTTALSSCVTITGATAKTYTPVLADKGKRLRVVETVSKPGFHNFVDTSLASTVVP